MKSTIKTSRLLMRLLDQNNDRNLWELHNDPAVMRWINGGRPTDFAVIKNNILPAMIAYADGRPGLGAWAIIDGASGNFLGWVSLRPLPEDSQAAELGYRLHRAVWGRGVAVEASRALIDLAFQNGSIERIVATTYEENSASRRVLKKLGLSFKRRFRYTPAELQALAPASDDPPELWPGDDMEYELLRSK